jgi:tetratricopeptide (TPR) repeat protein
VTLHQLVHDANAAHPDVVSDPAGFLALAARLVGSAADRGVPEDPASWPCWEALAPHTDHLLRRFAWEYRRLPRRTVVKLCESANLAGRYLYARGRYQQTAETYQRVLALQQRFLGRRSDENLSTRHNLAVVWHDQGLLDRAAAEYQQVLKIQQRVLGKYHRNTLGSRHNLALLRREQGALDLAATEFQAYWYAAHARPHDLRRCWSAPACYGVE